MSPEPSHFPEIKQDKLIELHGELNSFYVCAAGGKPGAEHCFFYSDNQYSFFFYADLVPILDDEYDIVIAAASTQRLRGPNPEILREDLGNI
jgi:hypothetical protein